MASLINGSALFRFTDLVSSLGGDGVALMRAHGVDPEAAGDYHRFLSYRAVCAVLGAAARELDCPDLGMRLAHRQGTEILGPVAVIIRPTETVADAIEGVSRYLHNCAPCDVTELRRGPGAALYTFAINVRQLAHRDHMAGEEPGHRDGCIAAHARRGLRSGSESPCSTTTSHLPRSIATCSGVRSSSDPS